MWTSSSILAIPVTHIIPQAAMECLYDTLHPGEYATVSLFMSTGDTFKAPLFFEGPFLPIDDKTPPNAHKIVDSANDPHHWDQLFQRWTNQWGSSNGLFREHMFADFEDVTDDYYPQSHEHEHGDEDEDDHYEEGLMDDQYYHDEHESDTDDIHSLVTEDDQMSPEQRETVRKENERRASLTSEQKEEERRKRVEERKVIQEDMQKEREERRKKYEARIKEKEEKKKRKLEEKQKAALMKPQKLKSGQAFLKTFHITDSGWYRFCVTAENGQVRGEHICINKNTQILLY